MNVHLRKLLYESKSPVLVAGTIGTIQWVTDDSRAIRSATSRQIHDLGWGADASDARQGSRQSLLFAHICFDILYVVGVGKERVFAYTMLELFPEVTVSRVQNWAGERTLG